MYIDFESFELYKGMSDLDGLATNFLKRSYLENLDELPRMQDIPKTEFIVNCKSPIFISHSWHDKFRPKNNLLERIKSFIPNQEIIGLWIDYCCVPQKQKNGNEDRIESELNFFKVQLQYIPTILLKSQLVVLWDQEDRNRAWCVVEYIVADIFKNVVMKQIYYSRNYVEDPLLFGIQSYNPEGYSFVSGVDGKPVIKILVPKNVMDIPNVFYNSVLKQLNLQPMLLTDLLKRVKRSHIDFFFEETNLVCSNISDIEVMKQTLHLVCKMAGDYDVESIKWDGKIPYGMLIPYINAKLSDMTITLVDYHF